MPRIGLDLPTLVHAATELADGEGLEAVTLATLAQRLNVRSPSLYNHVNGLPELRRQLALSGLAQMLDLFTTAVAGKDGDDAIRAFSYAYLSFARMHPGLYEAAQRAAEPNDTILQETANQVVQIGVKVLEDYGLKGDEVIHAVRVIRSMLHGYVSLERQGGFGIPLDLDDTFRLLVHNYIEGIKSIYNKN